MTYNALSSTSRILTTKEKQGGSLSASPDRQKRGQDRHPSPTTTPTKWQTKVNPKSFPSNDKAFTPNIVAIVLCVAWWMLVLHHIEKTLESHLLSHRSTLRHAMSSMNAPAPYNRYIIFTGHDDLGQGEGNILTGLLAAHLLGLEFDRIVCVPHSWTAFRLAFRPKHYQRECEEILRIDGRVDKRLRKRYELRSWNFGHTSSECKLRQRLSSNERILPLGGNTYPKWTDVPSNWFDLLYEPTDALQLILPWKGRPPPRIVVHLRMGDSGADPRKGLDGETMECLGKSLPKDTFLVTNNVDWYDSFSAKYGWSNPGWTGVKHSAISKTWGEGALSSQRQAKVLPDEISSMGSEDVSFLQLYADWYTLLRAKKVYHTVSDFSSSAVHWKGMESKIIMGVAKPGEIESEKGYNACELELIEEAWRRDGTDLPLKLRRLEDLTDQDGVKCWDESSVES